MKNLFPSNFSLQNKEKLKASPLAQRATRHLSLHIASIHLTSPMLWALCSN